MIAIQCLGVCVGGGTPYGKLPWVCGCVYAVFGWGSVLISDACAYLRLITCFCEAGGTLRTVCACSPLITLISSAEFTAFISGGGL